MKIHHAMGLLAFAAGLAAGADWRQFFATTAGQWEVRPGSVHVRRMAGVPAVAAYVRRTNDAAETIYLGAVTAAHCGQQRGDVFLMTVDGRPIENAVFVVGSDTLATALAAELCKVKP